MNDLDYENPILDILYAEASEPEWLIPKLLLQGNLVVLAGEPGSGKSYVSYTLALAIASGCSALSGLVPAGEPRTVVYFDEENSEQDRNAYITRSWNGLVDSKGVPPDPMLLDQHFYPVHFRLGGEDWYDKAAAFIDYYQPRLAVFDTANPCFDIGEENSNSEAAAIVKKVKHLLRRVTPTCSGIILKHSKIVSEKGGRRMIRGAKDWAGSVDQTMFQVRAQGRPRKGGLQLTRLVPDKTRAFGLSEVIYITPSYTDEKKTGLVLEASYKPDREHSKKLDQEEGDDD